MKEEKIQYFLNILRKILDSPDKMNLIRNFQEEVWNNEEPGEVFDRLSELAYDLDYYESNPNFRLEDESFYDENKLKKEIKKAINDLLNITNNPSST